MGKRKYTSDKVKQKIDEGWDGRRRRVRELLDRNNKKTKEWQQRELLGLNDSGERRNNHTTTIIDLNRQYLHDTLGKSLAKPVTSSKQDN